jgi:hypothetical protein
MRLQYEILNFGEIFSEKHCAMSQGFSIFADILQAK